MNVSLTREKASSILPIDPKSTAHELRAFPYFLAVAIVEPEYPLNLGHVARVMANFGLNELIVIGKKLGKKEIEEAAKFSSHGHWITENAKYLPSLDSLRKRFQIIVGTTAIQGKRKSNITRKTVSIEECCRRVADILVASGDQRACIVLGRDTTGLTNEELRKCDYVTSITTGSDYNTLNISHAATIVLYLFARELQARARKRRQSGRLAKKPPLTARREKELIVHNFEQLARLAQFQEFKIDKLKEAVMRMLNQSNPSQRELYLLLGVVSRAKSKIQRLNLGKRE